MSEHEGHLTGRQFTDAAGTEDWRVLGRTATAWFTAGSHAEGAALVRRVVDLGQASGLTLPDVDLRSVGVQVRLDRGPEGFPPGTVVLARAISDAARELGLAADPSVVQDVQLTIDASDAAAVMPFWTAALGYVPDGDEDTVDPWRRYPPIWWQDMDAPRPLRNRVHLDSVAPVTVTRAAMEAVRERAGSVADHGYYATVADAEGNEVDLLPFPDDADRWPDPATEDWRLVFSAMACYRAPEPAAAVTLAEAAAALADDAGLALSIDLRPGLVVLDSGKDVWEMVEGYDVLAARVQEAARRLGLEADTTLPRFVQVGIDAVDIPAVRRFWCAALGYEEDPREQVTDIVDPRRLATVVFFQDCDPDDTERRAQRNRVHVDVFLPADRAEERLRAALAAGGRVVLDRSPFWWTVADLEGNEVDLSVSVGREEAWGA
ncbi:hypothetical protein GCM10009584_24050 [Ornithinimicrobium humiphilum]|uniref:Glyoxalase-like domain-containing protein n=1 Tax=Ornithinimicrobium humiphilum TaxID=125288 RepID=A0A543KMJ7_9MICO|nr:VOC family protein [Ornithinimicrobium humiphilum]TQM96305.1 hypothetical protein FB476_1169 [Ornithinimicrobium humiphilum]